MDYEEKYKEALERARAINNGKDVDVKAGTTICEYIFPELAESEDEKVRKAIISGMTALKDQGRETFANVPINDCISWLKKQVEQKQLYIRFGEIPTDEKSKIYRGEIEVGTENGVSVYPAFKTDEGDIVLGLSLPITKTTLYTQQHLIEYDNRPCYLVNGDYIGKDTDGQPLINNVSIIKKIDSYRVKEKNQTEQEKDILDDAILDGNEDGLIAETIRYKHEKQAEQNQTDKVEPKFKVGDWVINPRTGLIKHIKNVLLCDNNGNYEFESSSMSIDSVDNSFRLWTIQDAKDGDVLKEDSCIFILEKIKSQDTAIHHCCLFDDGDFNLSSKICFDVDSTYPATKEQRDTLLKAMADAGYTFDFERKELKRIVQKPEENKGNLGGISANWSKEDERNLQGVIDEIEANKNQAPDCDLATYDRFLSWLKSLKGRVQPKVELTQFDKNILEAAIAFVKQNNQFQLLGWR